MADGRSRPSGTKPLAPPARSGAVGSPCRADGLWSAGGIHGYGVPSSIAAIRSGIARSFIAAAVSQIGHVWNFSRQSSAEVRQIIEAFKALLDEAA